MASERNDSFGFRESHDTPVIRMPPMSGPPPAGPTRPPPRLPYLALQHRDYRRLALAYLVSGTGSQMQRGAIHWHVFLLTRAPLALGFVGLTRVLPIVVFSLWGGVLADRLDRRKVMLEIGRASC